MEQDYSNREPRFSYKPFFKLLILTICFLFFNKTVIAQDYALVTVTGVYTGNEQSFTIFKVKSQEIPSLAYIKAQKIGGPQKGFFSRSGDNIRYTSLSKVKGMPGNKSRIRFSFLQADKRTPILLNKFRFIINDIDGPMNESLATKCTAGVRFVGTSDRTNLIIDNQPPDLNASGSVNEEEGATSRVMFEFKDVNVVEFDNYGNDGYFKDFDLNDDYPISTPLYVECIDVIGKHSTDFKSNGKEVIIDTDPIYFDRDSYYIRHDAATELDKVVTILNRYPKLNIEVRSHTDSRAEDDYNIELSNKRAAFSVNWIVNKGIMPDRIKGVGFGETQLKNKCSNGVKCSEEQHQLNRRTEFVILN